jgi:phosphohistidine phosphatase
MFNGASPMTCTIYLVRHGMAESLSPTLSDQERRLTAAGRDVMDHVAEGLSRLAVVPAVILASPMVRAAETAEILRRALARDAALEHCPALAPGNPVSAIFNVLAEHLHQEQILLVGHEPTMGELASCLLTGSPSLASLRFKPGAVAAIDFPSAPSETRGSLRWFIRAELLAAFA